MNLSQTEPGEGDERTDEIPVLGIEETQDLLMPPVVRDISSIGDFESLMQTALLSCRERMEAAVQRLKGLLSLLLEETLEALDDEQKVQVITEMQKIVTETLRCLQAESIAAWDDSNPEMRSLSLPAIRIDQEGRANTPPPKTDEVPVLLMQRALSILTPLDEKMDRVAIRHAAQVIGNQPITFFQRAHLLVKQAIVLLRVH